MGQTISVSAQIEIEASLAVVHSIFMDFARYKEWHECWTVEVVDRNKRPADLKVGDQLRVNMRGMPMVFHPYVGGNSSESFVWEERLPGILYGRHHFIFASSEVTPGGTTFIQREDFQGSVTVFFSQKSANDRGVSANWEAFNQALKKEAERVVALA
ncbi:hypothetical protein B0H63DRAFT_528916 [Podospora didyma]|uniref:SRPBCC domain-containing protein n=1 Tax=Podospora didyma TaxID=330526 RepID=A0AAE0N366_9PEZI|nr:hypothetical protein B0H63DRAFT_528916 [Podospora didyma]